jgi:hypothetical protein
MPICLYFFWGWFRVNGLLTANDGRTTPVNQDKLLPDLTTYGFVVFSITKPFLICGKSKA